jgi:threonine ammonia-lyase medium form
MASPLMPVSFEDVLAARELLEGVVRPTPLEYSRALSDRAGVEVFLKCENLQRAGSFKIRGAYTRMARLSDEEKARGVVAASAGNHAQGVALAAQLLGIRSTVFMPLGAPLPKLVATRAYGAHVEQIGRNIDDCLVRAREFAAETGAVLIHPFDHPDIVAGQGTCGLEILEQCPDVRTILVSGGGGGLMAGIATAVKAKRPDVRVVGVQAETAAAYPASLAAGEPVQLASMSTMADGIAVGLPGIVPYAIVRELVDGITTVSEESLSRALLFLLERAKLVVEPAGAAAVAHLLDSGSGAYEGPVVAVLSGGNIDPVLLLRIIRHGMAAAGRYLQFRVRVPDSPGSLARLLSDLAEADANVLEVEHVRTGAALRVDEVELGVQLETKGSQHCEELLATLRGKGYDLVFS